MDASSSSCLKTLYAITPLPLSLPLPLHFRSRTCLFRHLYLAQLNKKKPSRHSLSFSQRSSHLFSHSDRGNGNSLPLGAGDAAGEVSPNKLLQVVLVSPQPLGFQVDDTKLKRAGLDYWPYVVVKVHDSWAEFREYFMQQEGDKRLLAFTKRGTITHSEFPYRKGDYLVFGSETSGLPPDVLLDCNCKTFGGGTIRIPMIETYVRCLNLSVSVGIALYEASRQLNYEQLLSPSQTVNKGNHLIITEDIFA